MKQDRLPGSPYSKVLIVYECFFYSMSPLTLAVSLLEMEMSSVNAGTFLSNYIHLHSTIGTQSPFRLLICGCQNIKQDLFFFFFNQSEDDLQETSLFDIR